MKTATQARDEFLKTLSHIELVLARVVGATQPIGKVFASPDQHKLAEGLFLNAWTHWEQFVRELFIIDLATVTGGSLRSEIKHFRTKGAPHRLATLIVDHPDEDRWVEWSRTDAIVSRADVLLAAGHRFSCLSALQQTFQLISPIRNAVAHKSDVAWAKFRRLVKAAPFSLTTNQMKGLTVGRFLTAHTWGTDRVLTRILTELRGAASALVP